MAGFSFRISRVRVSYLEPLISSSKYYFFHKHFLSDQAAFASSSSTASRSMLSVCLRKLTSHVAAEEKAKSALCREPVSGRAMTFKRVRFTYLVWVSTLEVANVAHLVSSLAPDFPLFASKLQQHQVEWVLRWWRRVLVGGLGETETFVVFLFSAQLWLWKCLVDCWRYRHVFPEFHTAPRCVDQFNSCMLMICVRIVSEDDSEVDLGS